MSDDRRENKNMGVFGAGFVGAIIGAIGSAIAIVLSNKENRKNLSKKIDEYKVKGDKALNELKDRSEEIKDEVQEKAEQEKKKINQQTSGAKENKNN